MKTRVDKCVFILMLLIMVLAANQSFAAITMTCPKLSIVHYQDNASHGSYKYDYFAFEKINNLALVYQFHFSGEGNGVKFTHFEGADVSDENGDEELLCNYATSDDGGEVLWSESFQQQDLSDCYFKNNESVCDSDKVNGCPLICGQT